MKKWIILWGLSLGVTAVILGAFAAHALKEVLNAEQLASFQTGIRYQFYHALFLLLIGWQEKINLSTVAKIMIIGVILFSFSIYLLNLRTLFGIENISFLGPITPIGGLILIISWIMAILKVIQLKN